MAGSPIKHADRQATNQTTGGAELDESMVQVVERAGIWTVNDDVGAGYYPGYKLKDTAAGITYECKSNASGAAVWEVVVLGLSTVSQAEAEAGTSTTDRLWTAQRVVQALGGSSGSFTATGVGFSGTAPTATWTYMVRDGYVTLTMDTLSGTSNAVTFGATGLPAELFPSVGEGATIYVTDNGVGSVGGVVITAAGAITFYRSPVANWTASGNKAITTGLGFGRQTVKYKL